jgi:hypothetical protein
LRDELSREGWLLWEEGRNDNLLRIRQSRWTIIEREEKYVCRQSKVAINQVDQWRKELEKVKTIRIQIERRPSSTLKRSGIKSQWEFRKFSRKS